MSVRETLFEELDVHGEVGCRVLREAGELAIEWPGVGVFRPSSGFRSEPDVDPMLLRKFELGPVRAAERYLRGEMSLHGSAVSLGGVAWAFIGASGAGKSTFAAALCAREGASLIGDDVIALDFAPGGPQLLPGETEHWLDRSSRRLLGLGSTEEGKEAVEAVRTVEAPVPLVGVFHLSLDPAEIGFRLERARGRTAMQALARSLFQLPLREPARLLRDFDQVARLHAAVPIFDLVRGVAPDLAAVTARLQHATRSPGSC